MRSCRSSAENAIPILLVVFEYTLRDAKRSGPAGARRNPAGTASGQPTSPRAAPARGLSPVGRVAPQGAEVAGPWATRRAATRSQERARPRSGKQTLAVRGHWVPSSAHNGVHVSVNPGSSGSSGTVWGASSTWTGWCGRLTVTRRA